MVYVDELKPRRYGPMCFRAGSCHLTADTLDELHSMAAKIGCKRDWFQDHRTPHYDLTISRRRIALEQGAIERSTKDQIIARRKSTRD